MQDRGRSHRVPGIAALLALMLAGCEGWRHDTLLYVRDEVCRPGESVKLSAKLQENDWGWKDVKGKPLSFVLVKAGDKIEFLGGDVTNIEGRAGVTFRPPGPGEYAVEGQFAGTPKYRPASFCARVLCQVPTRYGIILDFDKTLAATTRKDMFSGYFRLAPPLDSDTVRVVNALAKEYDLFIVTSRPLEQAGIVLDWLERNGFPRVPTFFYSPRTEAIRPHMAKWKVIQDLKREHPLIAIGIGDRESDLDVYRGNGLLGIGIKREEKGAFSAHSWRDVESILCSNAPLAHVPSEVLVYRGKDVMRFWLSQKENGWQLEYALKDKPFRTDPCDSWSNQLKKVLRIITTDDTPTK